MLRSSSAPVVYLSHIWLNSVEMNQNEMGSASSFITETSEEKRATYLEMHDYFQLKISEIRQARKELKNSLELKHNYKVEIGVRRKFVFFLNINFSSDEADDQLFQIKQLKFEFKKHTSFPYLKNRLKCRTRRGNGVGHLKEFESQ